jgi:hypothetical protein
MGFELHQVSCPGSESNFRLGRETGYTLPDDTCEVTEVLNLSGGEFILQPSIQLKSAGTAQGGKYGIEVNERVRWQASPKPT